MKVDCNYSKKKLKLIVTIQRRNDNDKENDSEILKAHK